MRGWAAGRADQSSSRDPAPPASRRRASRREPRRRSASGQSGTLATQTPERVAGTRTTCQSATAPRVHRQKRVRLVYVAIPHRRAERPQRPRRNTVVGTVCRGVHELAMLRALRRQLAVLLGDLWFASRIPVDCRRIRRCAVSHGRLNAFAVVTLDAGTPQACQVDAWRTRQVSVPERLPRPLFDSRQGISASPMEGHRYCVGVVIVIGHWWPTLLAAEAAYHHV